MMVNLYILVGEDGFWGQSYNTWKSMDKNIIEEEFKKYNLKTYFIPFSDISSFKVNIENSLIIYTSSEKKIYKDYIEDLLLYLKFKNNILIPSFEHFKCHENKGFQEFFKKIYNINSNINAVYYGNFKFKEKENITFPIVYKTVDGAGSKGVSLLHNLNDLKNNINSSKSFNEKLIKRLKIFKSKIYRNQIDYIEYKNYYQVDVNFVLQEFISDLNNDYKVLVLNEKIYILKRYIRNDDFRASGSGKFEFVNNIDKNLLNYISTTFKQMDAPYVSMDICEKNKKYFLIEFQFLHFGPYTLQKSNGYFTLEKNEWKFVEEKSILEVEIVNSIAKYIKRKYKNEC